MERGANLEDLGDGPGFRKIRPALGVEEFGINAIVMPPRIESEFHFHDEQEELYFVACTSRPSSSSCSVATAAGAWNIGCFLISNI